MAASLMLLTPLAAQAQWWQQHPAYLHAMSDLRKAYWLVQHRDPGNPFSGMEEQRAAEAIRAAYMNLKNAAIVDNKDIDDQPPADTNYGNHRDRLQQARNLLGDAHNAVDREEDDPAAVNFRKYAIRDIDAAIKATDAAYFAGNF
jgi:hypothetical protein